MLDAAQSRRFVDFIEERTHHQDFEAWLYSDEKLELALGQAMYLRLIEIDYAKGDSRYRVEQLVSSEVDWVTLHKEEILKTLGLLLKRESHPIELLQRLHHFAQCGCHFLSESALIANLGEQGKSALLTLCHLDEGQQWVKLEVMDGTFFHWVNQTQRKLLDGTIVLKDVRRKGSLG